MLDFSRVEAGRMQVAFEPTDLGADTADLVSLFRSTFERAKMRCRRVRRRCREAGLRRSRHVGEDRSQPRVQRVQVHARR